MHSRKGGVAVAATLLAFVLCSWCCSVVSGAGTPAFVLQPQEAWPAAVSLVEAEAHDQLLLAQLRKVVFSIDDLLPSTKDEISDVLKRAKDSILKASGVGGSASLPIDPPPSSSASVPNCKIPDADALLAKKSYTPVDMNTQINSGYAELANCFQTIANGNKNDVEAFKKAFPVCS